MLSNCGAGEKSWETLGQQEIKPVNLKGNQSWIFIGRPDAKVEAPMATWSEEQTHWKRPWCWERLKVGGEGDDSRWDCWMASLTQWNWVWANSWRWWRIGKPGVLQSMGSQSQIQQWLYNKLFVEWISDTHMYILLFKTLNSKSI